MLSSVKELAGHQLVAPDGEDIGTVREVYFDDARWVIRHLVVNTGGWLSGRSVLVSPHAVRELDAARRHVAVELTRQRVLDAPGIETELPVSRQHEAAAYDHYGYPYYWGGSSLWGIDDQPLGRADVPLPPPGAGAAADAGERGDPHLRSSREVVGYDVAALDGDIGHLHDFLFDPRTWQILLLVVDTHNWLPDRLVLVPPAWVHEVDWVGQRATFKVSRQAVQSSPPHEARRAVDVDEVRRVQRHFEGMQ